MTDNTTTPLTLESLELLPVKIDYVGVSMGHWDDLQTSKSDQWRVTISGASGFHCFDYFTGMGLRETVKGVRAMRMPGNHFVKGELVATKPTPPKVADVLNCLLMDASAADDNFDDWCDNLGLSSDSIKALNLYKECLDTARALRKFFTPSQLSEIRELLQDY